MLNILSTATNTFLSDLSSLQQRMLVVQQQVTSGLSMRQASDNPSQVGDLLQIKADIAHNNQVGSNLGHVQTQVNTAENAINTATSLMDTARQIVTEANTGTATAATRTNLAGQIKDVITEVFGITSTNVEGRYVFSGDNDQVAPYASVDLTQANGVGTYNGSNIPEVTQHPNGTTFQIGLTAAQIFDVGGPSTSVLQSLTNAYNDLLANNQGALSTDVGNIQTASNFLSNQQAHYGVIQNQITDAANYQNQLSTQLQVQLGGVQDADAVSAATTLQQDSIAEQAAMAAQAGVPKKSLFDYLG